MSKQVKRVLRGLGRKKKHVTYLPLEAKDAAEVFKLHDKVTVESNSTHQKWTGELVYVFYDAANNTDYGVAELRTDMDARDLRQTPPFKGEDNVTITVGGETTNPVPAPTYDD